MFLVILVILFSIILFNFCVSKNLENHKKYKNETINKNKKYGRGWNRANNWVSHAKIKFENF
jgi:NADH:ubiquinone oxidoreductase subunit 3 (subunit A)